MPAIRGPKPPSPSRPWHLAQAPRHSSLPSDDVPACCCVARSSSHSVELPGRHDLDGGGHLRVVEPAELGALALEHTRPLGAEPGGVELAWDRVDLPSERRDPPGVDDVPVGRRHVELDGASLGRVHAVDRDGAVRIPELPRVLGARDLDDEVLPTGGRRRDVLDPRELREHEGRDREQDDHRRHRPRQLETGRSVDLRPVGVAGAPPASIAEHEQQQRHFDEQEDGQAEGGDEPEARRDALGVRRLGRDGSESPVARDRRPGPRAAQRARRP